MEMQPGSSRLPLATAHPHPPHNARRDVARLAQHRLETSAYPALRVVTCIEREGTTVLRGRVSSFYLKQLAQEVVRSVDGIDAICNEVEVDPPPHQPRGQS